MTNRPEDKIAYRTGRAHTFGWLRRPELGNDSHDVWERPDGVKIVVEKGADVRVEQIVVQE